jgi:hypothetical protein
MFALMKRILFLLIALVAMLSAPAALAVGRGPEVRLANHASTEMDARVMVDGESHTIPLFSDSVYLVHGLDAESCIRIWRSGEKPDNEPCLHFGPIRYSCQRVECHLSAPRPSQPLEIRIVQHPHH